MATTTNYGWDTPDDTDLVKDGAAAIRTLGSSIDTTVFNNASAAIAKSIIDAKGDLISATAADTPAILSVGTNGQYLSADSTAATGLKWVTPSGSAVVQAKMSLSTSSFSRSTNGNTNLVSVTITPTSNTNNIVLMFDAYGRAEHTTTVYGYLNIYDGTTSRLVSSLGWDGFTTTGGTAQVFDGLGGVIYLTSQGTSAITYTLRLQHVAGGDLYVDRPHLIAMEVVPS